MPKEHRIAPPKSPPQLYSTDRPFSNFIYIDENFAGLQPLRRIFSQARSFNFKSFSVEEISPTGYLQEENEDIASLYSDYIPGEIYRIAFWTEGYSDADDLSKAGNAEFLGYAIVKRDIVQSVPPTIRPSEWHVFESVFRIPETEHICVKTKTTYEIRCGENLFNIEGVLFCQQNVLNKACAQVAVRTLLSSVLTEGDISYREIHEYASKKGVFNPRDGLNSEQIRTILKELGLKYRDLDYSATIRQKSQQLGFLYYDEMDNKLRAKFPYSKFVYAGIESGWVSLLGFSLAGPTASGRKHIIPFFGHTFNKDTWVANAELGYFHVGEMTKYLPSESWLDCFMGHDDNFGSNFFLPRQYLDSSIVDYVISILPQQVEFDGVAAEAMAADIVYTILPHIPINKNYWLSQLVRHVRSQSIVFRAIFLSLDEYIAHLSEITDWEGNSEDVDNCEKMKTILPQSLWIVEISLPELFPVNYRKLGELVLDATCDPGQSFLFARIPEKYLIEDDDGVILVPSNLKSHTPLCSAFL